MRFSDDPKLLQQPPTAAPFLAIDDLDCGVRHRFKPDLTERFKVNSFDISPEVRARRATPDAYTERALEVLARAEQPLIILGKGDAHQAGGFRYLCVHRES